MRQSGGKILNRLAMALQQIRRFIDGPLLRHENKAAWIILGATFIFLLFFWFQTDGMPRIQDQTEPFNSYLVAENWVEHGLVKSYFLEDYATGSSPEAHPYYYIHNPNFPSLWSYFLIKIGIRSLSYQNLVAIFILLLGLWYAYKAISKVVNPLAGLFTLLMLATNYLAVLVYGTNLYRSWTWLLIFGTIFHLVSSTGEKRTARMLHFTAAAFLLFMTVYYDYGVALLLLAIVFFLKLLRAYTGSWKRSIIFLVLPTVLAFGLHSAFVAWALGVDVWFKDITMTLTNRAFGYPTREMLQEFYTKNYLVLWGYPELNFATIKWFSTTLLPEKIKIMFGTPVLYMTILWAVGLVLYVLYKIPNMVNIYILRKGKRNQSAIDVQVQEAPTNLFRSNLSPITDNTLHVSQVTKLIAAVSLGTLAVFAFLPSQVMFAFIGPFLPFFVISLVVIQGLTVWVLIRIGLSAIERRLYVLGTILGLGVVLLVGSTFILQWHNFQANPPMPFGSSQVLEKYSGYSSVTNFQTPYVRYFTKEWVTIVGWGNEDIKAPFTSRYTHEKDVFQDPEKYEHPDYIILQAGYNQDLPSTIELLALYDVVDEGDDYVIFKVEGKRETKDFDIGSYYKLDTRWAEVTASSMNQPIEAPGNLVDEIPQSYWHVKYPATSSSHWATVDIGIPTKIEAIGVLPREGHNDQFWRLNHATLEGSNDSTNWKLLSTLAIGSAQFDSQKPGWLYFTFHNTEEFRYYRININDTYFLSLAELGFYYQEANDHTNTIASIDRTMFHELRLSPDMITVSSNNKPQESTEALVDRNPETYWHVKFPQETVEHWLIVDFGQPQRVAALAILPRVGHPEQSWDADHATLQGSIDAETWNNITRLSVEKSKFDSVAENWNYYQFPDSGQFRYYRLIIRDNTFLSIAELELFVLK